MTFLSDLRALVESLAEVSELDVDVAELPLALDGLSDEVVAQVMEGAAAIRRCNDVLALASAGVVARRSTRDRGQTGMATSRGHRSPAALIQAVTGGSAAEAKRAIQVGEALLEGGCSVSGPEMLEGASVVEAVAVPWHEPLGRAVLRREISAEQHDAIRRGLGEPPVDDGAESASDEAREAWTIAAEQLLAEAATLPVEELRRLARIVRDQLDPTGAEKRFAQQFEGRSFQMYLDADGVPRGRFVFEQEGAAWLRAIKDSALRPRRGGPRFVGAGEQAAADDLQRDPRTNEQLEYDLLMDLLRAGALASAEDVFGARQPGVRMIVVKDAVGVRDALGRMLAIGHTEDRGDALPGGVIDRNICANGTREVTVDACGNPLDVGREQRLFTARQRIALAARDGGCTWPGCCVPASYCEAHHCNHWHEHLGRTDIDEGVLLCRFHHLLLHNQGWRITRDGQAAFILHPPGDRPPVTLKSKAAWAWAWDPPPPPDRAGWRVGVTKTDVELVT
ncbi:HNH endonuclease signature motif containing protein [Microbacterium sp. 2FI]|uniref:HNH endonuclease signature motif containing protein n=1 Tax=Microbacterium sp. 2FI TaxID=2502193 RepID=UPI0010F8F3B0|nr:HNH endonuclease signature motif containing protein [Microbacterium sp. 2FI]